MTLRLGLVLLAMGTVFAADDAYRADIENWRAGMEKTLKGEEGWLTVAGLFWLSPGEARVGSAADSTIVLPPPAPAFAAIMRFDGERVRLAPMANVPITVGDQPILNEVLLNSDANGPADVVRLGDISFFVIKRGDRYGIRVKDKNSKIRRDFTHRNWFPVKPEYRVEGRFVAYAKPITRRIPTVLEGVVEDHEAMGTIDFTLNGTPWKLEAVKNNATTYQIVFKDKTAGKETYGAARFLVVPIPGKDGKVTVDFNKAYNPPCAFNPYTTCPLPVKQNVMPMAVEAGELKYDH